MNRLLSLLAAVACFGLFTSTADAQADLCVPQARGVPFTSSAPPDFPTAGGQWESAPLDDPGWRGATQVAYGDGVTPQARVRGVFKVEAGVTQLYLSWREDIPLENGGVLYVGFSEDGTAANARIYAVTLEDLAVRDHVQPVCDLADPAGHCQASQSTHYRIYSLTGTDFTFDETATIAASWPNSAARVWAVDSDADANAEDFTIALRFPVNNGTVTDGITLASDQTVRFWYQLQSCDSGVCSFHARWPRAAPIITESFNLLRDDAGGDLDEPTFVSGWSTLNVGGSASCPAGVRIDPADIGVLADPATSPLTGALENRIWGQQSGLDFVNRFVARVANNSATDVPIGQITARFRIADWGTEPIVIPRPADWSDVPGGGAVTNATPITAGNKTAMTFDWTLSPAERCKYEGVAIPSDGCAGSPAKDDHQCVLVELTSSGAVLIEQESAYRNMNFFSSSVVEQKQATLSVRGLPALAGSPSRDVYLYIKTTNLPASYAEPTNPMTQLRAAARARVAALNKHWRGQPPKELAVQTKRLTAFANGVDATESVIRQLPRDIVDRYVPQLTVHAFHDTGKLVKVDDTDRKLLASQTGFGYYLLHDGVLTGWKWSFSDLTQVSDNLYKIAVDNNSARKITTSIESVEPGVSAGPDPTPPVTTPLWEMWWFWLLLVLGLLILAWVVRRLVR